jgi:small-conductance mechanosensitive channel
MNNILNNFTDSLQKINIFDLLYSRETFYLEIFTYILGIIFLNYIFQFLKYRTLSIIKDDVLKSRFRSWLNLGFVFVVAYLIASLFSKHSGTIIAISGILSAALVFALQDFVSSFFAWVFILSREKYRVGDVIKVAGTHSYIYGKVIKIEIFRTILEERMGDGDYNGNLNKEMITGRTVSIPNNMVMKGAVLNFTLENKALWHPFNLTITFDSDFELAESVLNEIMNEVFDSTYFKKHHIPVSYKPQISTYIAANGVELSLWFPATVGKFREVLDKICKLVLKRFKLHNIELAFTTITINNSTPPTNQYHSRS